MLLCRVKITVYEDCIIRLNLIPFLIFQCYWRSGNAPADPVCVKNSSEKSNHVRTHHHEPPADVKKPRKREAYADENELDSPFWRLTQRLVTERRDYAQLEASYRACLRGKAKDI